MKNMKKMLNVILNVLLSKLFGIFFSMLSSFAIALLFHNRLSSLELIIIAFLFGVVVFLLFLVLRKWSYPYFRWDYEIQENKFTLTIHNSTAEYRQSYSIKVRRQSEFTIHNEYDWSDAKVTDILVSPDSDNYKVFYSYKQHNGSDVILISQSTNKINTLPKSSNMKFDIKYPISLREGDTKNISIDLKLKDMKKGHDELFAIIKRPVKYLTMELRIENGIAINNIYVEGFTTKGKIYSIKKKKELDYIDDNGYRVYKETIYRPKIFCKYIIKWTYS